MEEELMFVCRLCNKRYPSGESLGDHMRCHVIENSAESGEKFEPNVRKVSSFLKINGGNCQDSTCEIGGQSGYGLRENPKKTWRAGIGGSKLPLLQRDQICKQCGKGFQSLKALCGHMACHSEKDRVLRDDHSWSTSDQKNQNMGFDWQSETEAEAAAAGPRQRPKRAASLRYKRISARSCSSHVSEIDHEQEEVAMCLMMLSRDYGKWVGLDSAGESSDNNSAVLETRSSSIDMKIRRKNQFAVNSVQNSAKRKGELKSGVWEPKAVQYENSDSGYFMNEANKVDSDVSVDGFLRNDDNCKKQKVDNGSELVKKGLDKGKCMGIEPRNGLAKGKGYGESGNPSTFAKFDTRRKKYESGSKKKQDFSFNQRKLKSKTKKSRGHECPVCHKVYKSGQALGGHKRSHFLGISEDKSNQIPVSKQEFSETRDLLDLNLPVSVDEEEANELSQFMPW
ncbi:hypothetical protein Vadar_002656 [Vaccinium darrowii]|uniref:Uncharacterized protein n=1 Tax=Vaccinium darrowii TaxID=229202 RepID=A0ACB7YST5_9ERIC|nr:hypothetical protein Vadar_002656 [Vaccinium darrowii]